MPQIKIEVTARRKRVIEAICLKHDCTLEALFEGKMLDLECNAAGIDLTDSDEEQEASVQKLERKATTVDADRKTIKAAQPKSP